MHAHGHGHAHAEPPGKQPGVDKLLFEFSQPRSDFSVHPQVAGSLPHMTSSSDTESVEIITEQPRFFRPHSIDESNRGTCMHASAIHILEIVLYREAVHKIIKLFSFFFCLCLESDLSETAAMDTQPTILYSLYYDIQRATLSVHIKQLFNLSLRRKHKTLDTYVALYLLPRQVEVFESKIVRDSLNPIFDQEFEFTGQPGMQILKKHAIVFKIYGYSK